MKEKIIFLRYAVIISFVLISCFQFNEIDYAQSNPVAQNLSFSQNFETTTFTETPTGMAAWTVKSSPKGNQSSAKLSTTNGDALITAATTEQFIKTSNLLINNMSKAQVILLLNIVWTDKGSLSKLVYILYKKRYICSKIELKDFFSKPCGTTIVRWDSNGICQLAYLLFRLHEEFFFLIQGNRGYFICTENHFTDFDGNNLKKNALKKLSYKINNEKDQFALFAMKLMK